MYKTPTVIYQFAEFFESAEDIIVYDCETTGLNPVSSGNKPQAHVIELSAKKFMYMPFVGFLPLEERLWYIRPVESLREDIVKLTGITDEFLADQPAEEEVFPQIMEFFGNSIVCGYNNLRFDDIFLSEMYKRYQQVFNPMMSLDVYKLAQEMIAPSEVVNYRLQTISAYCGAEQDMYHDAAYDVDATVDVAQYLMRRLEDNYRETGILIPPYTGGIRVKVSGISRYERGKLKRIYANTTTPDVTFYMEIPSLQWNCKQKEIDTDRFNMPDVIAQVLKIARVGSEQELTKYGKSKSTV